MKMLNIGDILTLELVDSEKKETFKCKLVDRKDPYLYIDYPVNVETRKTVYLLEGTQLKCKFTANDGSSYYFETKVLGRVKKNISMVILLYQGKEHLMKIQRRQFVRVDAAIDIAIHPTNNEFIPFTTVTKDISAGGVAILSREKNIKEGMEVWCWLVLPMINGEYHYIKILSKVVRIIPLEDNRDQVSLQFIEVNSVDQQNLLRFCFDQQIRQKRMMEER